MPLERLTEALRSQLAEIGVEVVVSSGSAPEAMSGDVLAVVWIERTDDALIVHFYEPAGSTLRERRIPMRDADAASVEEVAVIVRSAARALIDRAPDSPPPPILLLPRLRLLLPARSRRLRSPHFQGSIAYHGDLYSTDFVWQQGMTLALIGRLGGLMIGAEYSAMVPIEKRTSEVEVLIVRHPIALVIGYEVPLSGGRLRLRTEGAVVADPIHRSTRWVIPELEPTPGDHPLVVGSIDPPSAGLAAGDSLLDLRLRRGRLRAQSARQPGRGRGPPGPAAGPASHRPRSRGGLFVKTAARRARIRSL
ncbi:MAG: hypothetical protein MZW92_22345 [Comamonadaceae bacterium]|nr:hypothetical protein [Comamonadaceae bacterium]